MAKLTQYKGSPDLFEGNRYVGEAEAKQLGAFTDTPGQLNQETVQTLDTTRPDVKGEADFATLAGKDITMPEQTGAPTAPGAPQVNTGQPSPSTANATPFTQQALTPPTSKFEQGFKQANATLGSQPVTSASQANSLVQQYAPQQKNDVASTFIKQDPNFENLVSTWQEYINPKNQRASLADTYKQMTKDSGIEGIDMELINMKNVIEGTEDDIRNEITKAAGFASESQVQAMTLARNKSLIKNYNTLLDTRNSKEKYLQTMIQLEGQDREAADQRFESMFNMGLQIADYQQKMQRNAVDQFRWLSDNIGFDGIYDSVQGDPYSVSLIEQTMGLPSGALQQGAEQARLVKAQAEQQRQMQLQGQQLDLRLKQQQIKTPEQLAQEAEEKRLGLEKDKLGLDLAREQIATEKAQRAKIYNDMKNTPKRDTQVVDVGGKKLLVDSQTGETIREIGGGSDSPNTQQQMAYSKSQIDQIGNILNSGNLKTSVGTNRFSRINLGSLRNIFTPGASNFIADVQQLTSGLTIKNLQDAKANGATFGALQNKELTLLADAATKINNWAIHKDDDPEKPVIGYNAKESDFKREFDKINNFAKLDYILKGGNAADVGVQTLPDGTHWTKNSDGSMTQL